MVAINSPPGLARSSSSVEMQLLLPQPAFERRRADGVERDFAKRRQQDLPKSAREGMWGLRAPKGQRAF